MTTSENGTDDGVEGRLRDGRALMLSNSRNGDDGRSALRGRHVLILANRLPYPLEDGWKVRTYHVVRGVSRHARVTLLVFHPPGDTALLERAASALGPRVRLRAVPPPRAYSPGRLVRGLVTRLPVHVWNQESATMRRELDRVLAEDPPDLVISESTLMARYLERIGRGVPHVIDTHNIDSITFTRYAQWMRNGPRRWYAGITARKLAQLEADTFGRARSVWVCSDLEQDVARRISPDVRVKTVPNGVDTTYFQPAAVPAKVTPGRLLFFGRLDYYPNVDGLVFFVREILPRIREAVADIELQVIGISPAREIVELAESEPAVRLVGRVPDVRTALAEAAAVVVPLRIGGGTRLKIVEALSMARPLVSTRVGAEGLDVRDGEHLLLADEPDAFARAVITLLRDPAVAARLGANGRQLACQRYDWGTISDVIAASLDELVPAPALSPRAGLAVNG